MFGGEVQRDRYWTVSRTKGNPAWGLRDGTGEKVNALHMTDFSSQRGTGYGSSNPTRISPSTEQEKASKPWTAPYGAQVPDPNQEKEITFIIKFHFLITDYHPKRFHLIPITRK